MNIADAPMATTPAASPSSPSITLIAFTQTKMKTTVMMIEVA